MRNPLRSEDEAFRFLIASVVAALVIAGAAYVNTWLGVAAAVLAVAGILWWLKQEPVPGAADVQPKIASETPPGVHRVLVVANETVGGAALLSTLEQLAQAKTELLVIAPALASPVRHWTSDVDGARADAERRLEASVARLEASGLEVRGEIGDEDPLVAIEDALRTFGADAIVISTHPEGRSNWLKQNVVDRARERFALPVTHVVVDIAAEPNQPV
ncbi:MAG TPA: universal stress protein [Gaiellaceae bacterium]|nr:universal stress protein [Gaiellaceae bacterium]